MIPSDPGHHCYHLLSKSKVILLSFLSVLFVKVVHVLLWCHPCFFDQPAEKARTEGLIGMQRNREMDRTALFYEDVVATLDMVHDPSCPFEGSYMLIPPCSGEFRHN